MFSARPTSTDDHLDLRLVIAGEVNALQAMDGPNAVSTAEARAAKAAADGDEASRQFWTLVAQRLGDLEKPSGTAVADRLVSYALAEISRLLALASRGEADATTVHNLRAAAYQAADRARDRAGARREADKLAAAAQDLVDEHDAVRSALASGEYPSQVEAATIRLATFRLAVEP